MLQSKTLPYSMISYLISYGVYLSDLYPLYIRTIIHFINRYSDKIEVIRA